MEKIREKLQNLRVEADEAIHRAEEAEKKNKDYEQELLAKEHEITSLATQVARLEGDLDKAEKNAKDSAGQFKIVDVKAEHLEKQVTRLEEERDNWEKKYEEMADKYKASKAELEQLVGDMEGL